MDQGFPGFVQKTNYSLNLRIVVATSPQRYIQRIMLNFLVDYNFGSIKFDLRMEI